MKEARKAFELTMDSDFQKHMIGNPLTGSTLNGLLAALEIFSMYSTNQDAINMFETTAKFIRNKLGNDLDPVGEDNLEKVIPLSKYRSMTNDEKVILVNQLQKKMKEMIMLMENPTPEGYKLYMESIKI